MAIFTNQAQLSYNNTIINSNVAVGEVVRGFTISKTAVGDTYGRNDEVTYVVTIVNSSTSPLAGVSITDDLGGYMFGENTVYPLSYVEGSVTMFINGVLAAAPTVDAGPPLVFSDITIPAQGNAVIVYEAAVTEFAPLDVEDSITNTVTVDGDTASETITTQQAPELAITKAIEPVPVEEFGTVTYTFTILNYGNTPAQLTDDTVLTDTFNPALTNITVTFNGTPWADPANYTYDETTGLFTTIAGQITVPAATYTVDENGATVITPGVSELVVTGTI